jgi:hypothetical protein
MVGDGRRVGDFVSLEGSRTSRMRDGKLGRLEGRLWMRVHVNGYGSYEVLYVYSTARCESIKSSNNL